MDQKKAPSPFAVLWSWASGEHGGFYASVALAVLGVACGMVPYFCVAAMIGLLLEGGGLADCLPWCGLALAGYAGKALFSTWSTSLSHTATYHTLRRVQMCIRDRGQDASIITRNITLITMPSNYNFTHSIPNSIT